MQRERETYCQHSARARETRIFINTVINNDEDDVDELICYSFISLSLFLSLSVCLSIMPIDLTLKYHTSASWSRYMPSRRSSASFCLLFLTFLSRISSLSLYSSSRSTSNAGCIATAVPSSLSPSSCLSFSSDTDLSRICEYLWEKQQAVCLCAKYVSRMVDVDFLIRVLDIDLWWTWPSCWPSNDGGVIFKNFVFILPSCTTHTRMTLGTNICKCAHAHNQGIETLETLKMFTLAVHPYH